MHSRHYMQRQPSESEVTARVEIKGKIRADGPQEEIGSRNTAVQQQEPRALQILNGRNSAQECGVLANFGLQLLQNELPCAHRCDQNGDSPLAWPTVKITSPHSRIRVDTCGSSLQSLDPRWGFSTLVERILACCHNSSAMTMWHSTVRSCGDTANKTSRKAINRSPSLMRPDASVRAVCWPSAKRRGINRSPCSPPRPSGCGGWSQRRPPTKMWRGCCKRA